jgi:hypothetical protein
MMLRDYAEQVAKRRSIHEGQGVSLQPTLDDVARDAALVLADCEVCLVESWARLVTDPDFDYLEIIVRTSDGGELEYWIPWQRRRGVKFDTDAVADELARLLTRSHDLH